ncbi:HlyD family type I secretion periplasmic adaptor subunit [Lentilitoribacter sp. Alg239-R112]|uniref:HlyD family type I secretion periplasmic adaptor subunit n=1 Tax=Lentilitoribacter sp. Alg239-R112 TaxID=2305987 RepID=UPI0013A6FCD4|nr:HlyD family type I secretion periplasmic adaptor subunit [Lentilitoribacter sp. Alg239-R112]
MKIVKQLRDRFTDYRRNDKSSSEKALLQPHVGHESKKLNWKDNVSAETASISRRGYIAVGVTLFIFVLWGSFSSISGAVIANGKIIIAGQNKLLQHPTGGVVRQISAKDGAFLNKGDLVAIIDPSEAISQLAQLRARKDVLIATQNRIRSSQVGRIETANLRGETFYGNLRGGIYTEDKTYNEGIYLAQIAELNASSNLLSRELSALKNQLSALESEYISVGNQAERNEQQLALLSKQLKNLNTLRNSGSIAENQVWQIESQRLTTLARLDELKGSSISLVSRMDEVEDRIAVLKATRKQDNSRELTDVLSELGSIKERIEAAERAVEYSEIRAPVSGTLTNLTANTIGGVINSSDIIAEIVPSGSPVQVEARIMPTDVASVYIDQNARVVITAFNARLVDPIDGRVNYISADSQIDPSTGETYFTARISLQPDQETISRVQAGMYSQVFIETEARSFFSYALQPITDSFRKAFREK